GGNGRTWWTPVGRAADAHVGTGGKTDRSAPGLPGADREEEPPDHTPAAPGRPRDRPPGHRDLAARARRRAPGTATVSGHEATGGSCCGAAARSAADRAG